MRQSMEVLISVSLVSGIHLLLRWQLPTVGWTACGLRACIVEKYVWFSAVLHVADESGSSIVHRVGTLLGTLLQIAWSRLFTFLLRWSSDDYDTVRKCEGYRIQG